MKIGFYGTKTWQKVHLKKVLKGHKLEFIKEKLTIDTAKNFDMIGIFIYSIIDSPVLKKMPKLKMIATMSTGFDHIDLKECKKRKVAVYNVPAYGSNTVAEHTFALILALSRNVHKSYLRTLRGDYTIKGLEGFDLNGKTIGIIGAGKIGLHVIRIAKGFGMKVLAFDLHHNDFLAEVMGFEYATVEDILKNSDIISLHAPYNKHTHHMINKKNIKLVKKGAILINTSRGGLVDTDALIYALDKKILSGAGLDVLEGEKLIMEEKQMSDKREEDMSQLVKDHILLNMENVVFTPHIAFYSKEALQRIVETTAENMIYFTKKEDKNRII